MRKIFCQGLGGGNVNSGILVAPDQQRWNARELGQNRFQLTQIFRPGADDAEPVIHQPWFGKLRQISGKSVSRYVAAVAVHARVPMRVEELHMLSAEPEQVCAQFAAGE